MSRVEDPLIEKEDGYFARALDKNVEDLCDIEQLTNVRYYLQLN